MMFFKQYMLLGGMPQSVIRYLENHRSFVNSDKAKRNILKLYNKDISKLDDSYRNKVIKVFDLIPRFLSKSDKRVVYYDLSKNSGFINYIDTFYWLKNSFMINECFCCNEPTSGLSINMKRTTLKCYMGDTGLLASHTFDKKKIVECELVKKIIFDKLDLNYGMFFENIVAQMLVANGHNLFYYYNYNDISHKNENEIDFIISNESKIDFKIFPFCVKSSTKYRYYDLIKFMEKYKDVIDTAYVIHPNNLMIKNNIKFIPPYMTICL